MTTLDNRERESVAIGAAVAAGCRPCTRYHVNAALKAGLSEEEVRWAVREAEALRVEAVRSIAEYARGLIADGPKWAAGEDPSPPAGRLQALVRVGAASGGNAGYLLGGLLPQARGQGLSDEALQEAVQLAGMVKNVAADFFRKDAERALGRREEVAAAAEAGGCVGSASAPAGQAVQPASRGCC